jgi:signal transduction histidine kinase
LNAELAEELAEAIKNGEDTTDLIADIVSNSGQIAQHGKRADSIVRAMMQHASGGTGDLESTDINSLVDEYVGLAFHGMRASKQSFNVDIKKDFDEAAGSLAVVPQEIGRVLLNLIGNAFYVVRERSLSENGAYKPTVSIRTKRIDDDVEIRIADNGTGMPEHVKAKIFEPFFTTKPTGSGTGLGLSLSYDIVTKGHRGTMKVESEPGQGAEFIITLPGAPE